MVGCAVLATCSGCLADWLVSGLGGGECCWCVQIHKELGEEMVAGWAVGFGVEVGCVVVGILLNESDDGVEGAESNEVVAGEHVS